jgi:hypothetical protein
MNPLYSITVMQESTDAVMKKYCRFQSEPIFLATEIFFMRHEKVTGQPL